MRKLLTILLLVLVILFGLYFFVKNTLHLDKNAIVTSIKPPAEKVAEKLPQGSDLNKPFDIPAGFRIAAFSELSAAPRVLAFDENNILFVSIPSKGQIIALPDKNADGVADEQKIVLQNLHDPHGIAFNNNQLYVAETGQVSVYDYNATGISVTNKKVLFSLPAGGRHWSRTIKIHENKLYTAIGSSCDVCVESDEKRSTILISDLDGKNLEIFASGLRNTVFFDFDSRGQMWGNDMGRDFLGDNLPPDELNLIEKGKDYGWPWCYGDKVRDQRFESGKNLNYCENTVSSAFNYPAHIAPLGLTFINSPLFVNEDQGDILSSFHGSWNSSVPVGYKIVKVNIENGKAVGIEDFITGFLNDKKEVIGRPVDLIFDKNGVLNISDDKANLIYLLTK
jgi:glucose/arabinose dehydrogenase